MRILEWLVLLLVTVAMFVFGAIYNQAVNPWVVAHIEYVPRNVIQKEVEVNKEVYPTQFRQFASQEELSQWQAKQYSELQNLGKQNSWVCVDYALEMQRRAWFDGYQMSVENLLDKGGKTGHAICSTWIGNECIYLEPQSTISWVGALKGEGAIMYTPILFYPGTDQAVYREE